MTIECPKCHFENKDDTIYCGKCATELKPPEQAPIEHTETLQAPQEELTTGSTFAGRYQIIEELGKGGMGKVYKAQDTEIKEKVAIKLIKPEISADKKTVERFQNELKFARKIVHKNVGRMYDLGKEEGNYYITMEYVEGQDLKGVIRQTKQLTIGTTISIAKQICEGLKEAHNLGVVHRDLKPSNIMIDKNGDARIMDFGIARSTTGKGITDKGIMIGTPEYMSPEQVEGKEIDQRTDIYSLGIILYEMLTGRVPFEGDTALTVAVKHKTEEPKEPKEYNEQISDDLNGVILKCLEKDKEKRYQSSGEVRSELENIGKGIPTTDREIPKRKAITSKEITVTLGLRKMLVPLLIFIAIIIIGIVIWQLLLKKEAVPSPLVQDKPSIAVLPFEDLSPQKDQEYLCDGFSESLINALNKINGLRIPGRTSSFLFKDKERDIQEIGERLNVNTVLEGTVQKAYDKLRITVKLIDVSDESLLWSEQYSRELDDIFIIQDDITSAIVKELKISLIGEERKNLAKRYTDNQEAYNQYLRGIYFLNDRTEEGMVKSIDYFNKAIELDPAYALAYVGLADSYILLAEWEFSSPQEVYPKAKNAALKALEIDDKLSEAHCALAMIKRDYEWDWVGAEREFKRAIELNPNYPTAHQWYAEYLTCMARHDEAIEEIGRATELDPLSINIASVTGGVIFYYAREFDRGIEQCKKALDLDPTHYPSHFSLAWNYRQKEIYEEAIVELNKAIEIGGASFLKIDLACTYALSGERAKAQMIVEDLRKVLPQGYVSSYYFAMYYFAIGENDQGFRYLDKAFEERNFIMVFIKVDPFLDGIRHDPRFKAILKKMNLE
jgi:serine/threonine protein kinase/tetratricopeptide (TPR) repeat protein